MPDTHETAQSFQCGGAIDNRRMVRRIDSSLSQVSEAVTGKRAHGLHLARRTVNSLEYSKFAFVGFTADVVAGGAWEFDDALMAAADGLLVKWEPGNYVAAIAMQQATAQGQIREVLVLPPDAAPRRWGSLAPTAVSVAELQSIGSSINASGKFAGMQVWVSSTKRPLWASGPAMSDAWNDSAGVAVITPA